MTQPAGTAATLAPLSRPAPSPRRRRVGKDGALDYAEVGTWLMALFGAFVLEKYLQVPYRIEFLGEIRFELIFGSLLVLIALLTGPRLAHPISLWGTGLIALMALMVPLSYNPTYSYEVFSDRVIKFAMLTLFIVAFCKGPKGLRWFVWAWLLAFLKMGQEAMLGWWTGSLVWENQGVMRLHGSTPMYHHPNSLAGTMLGPIPFVLYLYPHCTRFQKILLAALGVSATLATLFSGSRTGYLGAVAIFVFVLFRSKNLWRGLAIGAVLLTVTIPFIPDDYKGRFTSIFTGKDKEGESTEARKQILRDAVAVFAAHPFGVGVSAFPTVRIQMFGRDQDTHNLYLEVATNIGIHGLVLFLAWVVVIWRSLHRSRRELAALLARTEALQHQVGPRAPPEVALHRADLQFMLGVTKATQLFLVTRLVLGLFGMDMYEIYWWFAAGLAIALTNMLVIAAARTQHYEHLRDQTPGPGPAPIAAR